MKGKNLFIFYLLQTTKLIYNLLQTYVIHGTYVDTHPLNL